MNFIGFIPVFPTNLQTAQKPIVPIATCSPLFDNIVVDNNNVCTGPLDGGVGGCSGDSGSPLVQNDELVGIFSHTFVVSEKKKLKKRKNRRI